MAVDESWRLELLAALDGALDGVQARLKVMMAEIDEKIAKIKSKKTTDNDKEIHPVMDENEVVAKAEFEVEADVQAPIDGKPKNVVMEVQDELTKLAEKGKLQVGLDGDISDSPVQKIDADQIHGHEKLKQIDDGDNETQDSYPDMDEAEYEEEAEAEIEVVAQASMATKTKVSVMKDPFQLKEPTKFEDDEGLLAQLDDVDSDQVEQQLVAAQNHRHEVEETIKQEKDNLVRINQEKEGRIVNFQKQIVSLEQELNTRELEAVSSAKESILQITREQDKILKDFKKDNWVLEEESLRREREGAAFAHIGAERRFEYEENLLQLVKVKYHSPIQVAGSMEKIFNSSLNSFSSEIAEKQAQINLVNEAWKKIVKAEILAKLEIEEKKLIIVEFEDELEEKFGGGTQSREIGNDIEEIGRHLFQTSHLFHQCSSHQLKSAFSRSLEDGVTLELDLVGASSPTLPQSVSGSRGKDYRSNKCSSFWSFKKHCKTCDNLFNNNLYIVETLTEAVAKYCHDAFAHIISNSVNSRVSIAAEILKQHIVFTVTRDKPAQVLVFHP